jgi:isopentenyldiphosphate isomerase
VSVGDCKYTTFYVPLQILEHFLFFCTFAGEKVTMMNHDNMEERFPVVDATGMVIGCATRGECHSGSHLLHPVVHLHVFNSRGEVYLQKRPEWKDIQPGKWDTAVGGHVDYGETPEEALMREVREELGITDFVPERLGMYVFDSQRESELVYVNRTVYDGAVNPSADELAGGRFWVLDEIRDALGKQILTPNFESEFQRFFLKNTLNPIK